MEAIIRSRTAAGVPVLDVGGELDLYTSPKLKAGIDSALGSGDTCLVINLLETTYMDSTALAVLTSALQDIRQAGGNLGLIFNKPQIARLFTITGLGELFQIYQTEADALEAVKTWVTVGPQAQT